MFEIAGRFTKATVYAETIDADAVGQITQLTNMPYMKDAAIRIMPDAHAGAGCVVGTTIDIRNRPVSPSLIGCDIGCGMLAVRLKPCEPDLEKLDAVIRKHVPAGQKSNPVQSPRAGDVPLENLRCATGPAVRRARSALATLGGGNHFIELDRSEADGSYWLVIHSGSRCLGITVMTAYLGKTVFGRDGETGAYVPSELGYLEGRDLEDYLHDAAIARDYASVNRRAMAEAILAHAGLEADTDFETMHNYIDAEAGILRKGAISAEAGERILIPLNMRDGALLCEGLGNPDWNMSAPHGAGRVMSRADAKAKISLDDYRAAMTGVYTTCVSRDTVDESPMAYKDEEEITRLIRPAAIVKERLRPVYNFKAGGR